MNIKFVMVNSLYQKPCCCGERPFLKIGVGLEFIILEKILERIDKIQLEYNLKLS